MPIYRAEHKRDFTMILNEVLNDTRLSYGARGLMAHALTHYDDWSFAGEEYFITDKDKKSKVKGYLKELIEFGYLNRYQVKNENGIFGNAIYNFYELPRVNLLTTDLPTSENRITDKNSLNSRFEPKDDLPITVSPTSENRTYNNTNINNTNIYSHIFDYWISKNIKKHRKITAEIKKAIDKTLKEYTQEEIVQAINNYGTMYNDKNCTWCTYQWGLNEFLLRKDKDGIRQLGMFLDDGSKYCNYIKSTQTATEKSNYMKPTDIVANDFIEELYK